MNEEKQEGMRQDAKEGKYSSVCATDRVRLSQMWQASGLGASDNDNKVSAVR